jgi:hypothetical protein
VEGSGRGHVRGPEECLIKDRTLKGVWEFEVQLHAYITFALREHEWSLSLLDRSDYGKESAVGLRAGLDVV